MHLLYHMLSRVISILSHLYQLAFFWPLAREEFVLSFLFGCNGISCSFESFVSLLKFTNQPIPNSVYMSAFWRCMGIFDNGRRRLSLKHWRHDSFNLWLNTFSASFIMIYWETTSYSTSVSYLPMQDAYVVVLVVEKNYVLGVGGTLDIIVPYSTFLEFIVIVFSYIFCSI